MRKDHIYNLQSIACDLSVFFFSLFLSDKLRPFLERELLNPNQSMQQANAALGWLYISAACAQAVGMWLMKPALHYQMHMVKGPSYGTGSFAGAIFLLVMHFCIFGVLFIWDGFRFIWGNMHGFKIILPILCCMIPTAIAIIISFPGKKPPVLKLPQYILSWVGTLLVTFSVVVASQACWHLLLDGASADLHQSSVVANIVIIILFGFVFLLLYLPARYVFLITEYHLLWTWLRILSVFIPFAYAIFKG